jgi:hypothetical protein
MTLEALAMSFRALPYKLTPQEAEARSQMSSSNICPTVEYLIEQGTFDHADSEWGRQGIQRPPMHKYLT